MVSGSNPKTVLIFLFFLVFFLFCFTTTVRMLAITQAGSFQETFYYSPTLYTYFINYSVSVSHCYRLSLLNFYAIPFYRLSLLHALNSINLMDFWCPTVLVMVRIIIISLFKCRVLSNYEWNYHLWKLIKLLHNIYYIYYTKLSALEHLIIQSLERQLKWQFNYFCTLQTKRYIKQCNINNKQ